MGRDRRPDGSLRPDYLIRVDYTADSPVVTLRTDNRHTEEIEKLTREGLIPNRLQGGASFEYSPESFSADFRPLYEYSLKREPGRYQALLYLNKDEVLSVAAEKEALDFKVLLDIGVAEDGKPKKEIDKLSAAVDERIATFTWRERSNPKSGS